MPFIVNGVCQYTVNGLMGTRPMANVLHVFIDTTGTTTGRPSAVQGFAEVVLNTWHTRVLPLVSNQYFAQSVSWVDLDSPTGSVGSISASTAHTWPVAGSNIQPPTPTNVAVLVTKLVTAQRGARKGRMFIGGICEDLTDTTTANQIRTTNMVTWQAAFTGFKNDLNLSAGGPFSYDTHQVVPHILTRDAPIPPATVGNPATGIGLTVSALTVQSTLATQRRRLRG